MVNKEVKKKINKIIIQQNSCLKRFNNISKIITAGLIMLCILYVFLCLVIPDYAVVRVRGNLQKNYYSIITDSVVLLIFSVVIRVWGITYINNRASKDCMERVNEKIIFSTSGIEYFFRIKYHSQAMKMVVVQLETNSIEQIKYDEKSRKLRFNGRFKVSNADFNNNFVSGTKIIDNFVVYDYFEPSIYDYLVQKNIEII